MATTVGVARSEDQAQLEPENSGVFHQSRTVWPNNVLDHRLGVEPLVHLDAVVKLEHRFIDLRRPSSILVSDLFVVAVIAISEGDAYLVLIPTRNQVPYKPDQCGNRMAMRCYTLGQNLSG